MPDGAARLPLLLTGIAVIVAVAVALAVVLGEEDEGGAGIPVALDLPRANSPGFAPSAGRVRFVRDVDSASSYLLDSSATDRTFMREHYWRMRGYPPTSDPALDWAPPMHFYADLYALYPDDPRDRRVIEGHPDWILRDEEGRRLYVPFGCSEGTCPAYAADPGSSGWRAEWIRRARRELAKGYAGVFVDNVNMELHVGDGDGEEVPPIDPRTGQPMSLADWQAYVADFVGEIRAALGPVELVHNLIWFAKRSAAVRSEVQAADYVELERGFNDEGITDPGGYRSLLDYVDWVHSLGAAVMLQPYDLDDQRRLFELASYFLINNGQDSIASDFEADPGNWWLGWDVELGSPLAEREGSGGVWRRDFERGIVLVNPPGAPQRSVSLPFPCVDLAGAPVETVELGPREGAVLLRAG